MRRLSKRMQYIWLIGLLLVICLLHWGCGYSSTSGGGSGSAGGGITDGAPKISDPRVNPSALRFDGGTVSISATVTDATGIQSVWAEITKPDSSKDTVTMTKQTGDLYHGDYISPGNSTTEDQVYIVHIYAKDSSSPPNQSGPVPSDDSLVFKVFSAGTPPPPPA